ncbi:Hypothetical predicted protein [Olea europaea subsp. europaea]|uniref:Uncharacterized protein n=1 Tax=Olea europaea subsp. europaea TaxID=158383 RepID=A0A8S0SB09_OLEEU|nr:Hypothetical predicted protein [Olea europaea subsp. europaea]
MEKEKPAINEPKSNKNKGAMILGSSIVRNDKFTTPPPTAWEKYRLRQATPQPKQYPAQPKQQQAPPHHNLRQVEAVHNRTTILIGDAQITRSNVQTNLREVEAASISKARKQKCFQA